MKISKGYPETPKWAVPPVLSSLLPVSRPRPRNPEEHWKGDPNVIQDQIQYNSDADDGNGGGDGDSDKY